MGDGTTANEDLVRDYLARIWGRRDLDALGDFLAPHYRRHLSPTIEPLTVEGQRQRLSGFQAAFPDAEIGVDAIVADGDLVAFRSTLTGTHRAPILGLAPTSRRIEVSLLDIVRIEDGLFVEHWGGPDLLDLARQLGATLTTQPADGE